MRSRSYRLFIHHVLHSGLEDTVIYVDAYIPMSSMNCEYTKFSQYTSIDQSVLFELSLQSARPTDVILVLITPQYLSCPMSWWCSLGQILHGPPV